MSAGAEGAPLAPEPLSRRATVMGVPPFDRQSSSPLYGAYPVEGVLDGPARNVDDVAAADGNGEGFRLEALSVAVLALALGHVPLDLGANHVGLGLAVPAFEVVDDALECRVPAVHASALGPVLDTDTTLAGAVQEDVDLLLREPVERLSRREAVLVGDGGQEAHHPRVGGAGAHPRLDGALDEAQVLVRYDEIRDRPPACIRARSIAGRRRAGC